MNKTKLVAAITLVVLALSSAGVYANVYQYNITPCDAIDISLTDASVINFLDCTSMATVDVYNCEYKGYNTWLVKWYTRTQSKKVYVDIHTGEIVGTGPVPEPCWHTVTTFQGRYGRNTPDFLIKGDTWHMRWETVGHENDSLISVTVYKDLGFYTFVDGFSGNNFPFSDTYCVYTGPGTYRLAITADELEYYQIVVEDYW